MLNKNIMVLAIIIVSLLTIGTVSALDNTTSDFVSVDNVFVSEDTDSLVKIQNDVDLSGNKNINENSNDLLGGSEEIIWEDMQSNVSSMDLFYMDSKGNTVSSSNYVTVSQYGNYNQFISVKMKTAFTGTINVKYDDYNYLTKKSLDYSDSYMPTDFEDYFYKNEGKQTFYYDLSSWNPGLVYMTVKKEDSNPVAYISFYITKGISAPDVVKKYGGSEKFIVNLFDDKNNPIKEETVTIFLNGLKYTTKTNNSGIASINLNLNPGKYDVVTVQDKNTVFSKVKITSSAKFIVNDINCAYNSAKDWVITLNNDIGNPISNKTVTMLLNGEKYNKITDKYGIVSFSIPTYWVPGTYSATFSFEGDDVYTKISTKAKMTISKIKTQLTVGNINNYYNAAKKWVVTLKDTNGKPLIYKTVHIILNGEIYTRDTDNEGQAIFSIPTNLAPKTYTASFRFAGDDYLEKYSTNAILKVFKSTPKLTANNKNFKIGDKTKKYTVTLKNNQDKIIKNTKVTLKVNGKTYSAKTNSKGQAIFKLTKLNKKGTHTATIKVVGNSNYQSTTKKVKIAVMKPATSKSVKLKVIYSHDKFPKKKLRNGDVIMTFYEKYSKKQWSPGVYARVSYGEGLLEAKNTKLVKCQIWFKNSLGKIITKSSTKFQHKEFIKIGLQKGYTPYNAQIWYK